MKQVVQENYERIKAEAGRIVAEELERIKNDPVPVSYTHLNSPDCS